MDKSSSPQDLSPFENDVESINIVPYDSLLNNEISAVKTVFQTMTRRRYDRELFGVDIYHSTTKKFTIFFIVSFLIYCCLQIVFYFTTFQHEDISQSSSDISSSETVDKHNFITFIQEYGTESLIMIVMTLGIIFSLEIIRPLVAITLVELYWFIIIYFSLQCYNDFTTNVTSITAFILVVAVTLTFGSLFHRTTLFIPSIFIPQLSIVTVEESSKDVRRYTLQTTSLILRKKKKYTLEGTMKNNSFDGTIVWVDNQPFGESLTGEWKDGKLVGPFESSVFGQRSLIRSVSLLSYEMQRIKGEFYYNFTLNTAESCYSGKMFYNLPSVSQIYKHRCSCVGDCSCVQSFLDDIHVFREEGNTDSVNIRLDDSNGSLNVSGVMNEGFIIPDNCMKMRTIKVLGVDEVVTKQCVLYLCGTMDGDQSLKDYGQFLTLAKLPNHIVPIFFSLSKQNEAPDYNDTYLHLAFGNLLQSIISSNITHLHIFASGNTFIFLMKSYYLWRTLLQSNIVLDNLIIINPDGIQKLKYSEFKKECLRILQHTKHTTLYSQTSSSSSIQLLRFLVNVREHSHSGQFDTVDIIDVDDLEDSNYFSINEVFIQDVVELILYNKPAKLRSRGLQQYDNNFFKFSLVPQFVRMV
ncbi:Uncharacterized protein QTN25_009109 [Entamoeba marina]